MPSIKEYHQSPKGIKLARISRWKRIGVKCDDWEVTYERYINTKVCDVCQVELVGGIYGANKKCLDHCHKTGNFRNVLCNDCNIRRGE